MRVRDAPAHPSTRHPPAFQARYGTATARVGSLGLAAGVVSTPEETGKLAALHGLALPGPEGLPNPTGEPPAKLTPATEAWLVAASRCVGPLEGTPPPAIQALGAWDDTCGSGGGSLLGAGERAAEAAALRDPGGTMVKLSRELGLGLEEVPVPRVCYK